MISREHKAIFIHIHKTAGSSIEKKLGLYKELYRGAQDHRKISDYEKIAKNAVVYALQGALTELRYGNLKNSLNHLNHMFSPELTHDEYRDYFKFSFVRNSWSRIYSWYKNVMRDDLHKKSMNISNDCSLKTFIWQ